MVTYDDTITDMYVPIFTLTRFILYFGWLHVAESLINPFGEDDEDFDINYLINRNVQISYLMVEGTEYEDDLEDPYEKDLPILLPHTKESIKSIQESQTTLAYATDNLLKKMTIGQMAIADKVSDNLDGVSKMPSQDVESSMKRRVLTKSASTAVPSVTRRNILARTISSSPSMALMELSEH
jgi:hypothetical protein